MPPTEKPARQLPLGVGAASKPEGQNADYLGLFPSRVMPTGMQLLQQGGAILAIRRQQSRKPISDAQDKLFRTLCEMGNHQDSPGSVTVFVVWGSTATAVRDFVKYDWTGRHEVRGLSNMQYRDEIRDWWNTNQRGR